jgi:hypothetical protein
MEVLSNKEIFVLLKILSNKRLLKGLSPKLQVNGFFTKEELEHLQQEMSLFSNKSLNKIIKIKSVSKVGSELRTNSGHIINIIDANAIKNYVNKYVEAFINDKLIGLTPQIKFSSLFKEFQLLISKNNDNHNFTIKDLKYMPIVLFAYINDLIELKDLSLNGYDSDNPEQCLLEDGSFSLKVMENGKTSEVKINMDITSLSEVMIRLDINGQVIESPYNMFLEMIAENKAKKSNISSECCDENAINKLKKDFRLTETEVNILCACQYLMNIDIDGTNVTNSKISEYLSQNDFPISVDSIKQCTVAIKNKCVLSNTIGVASLIRALGDKGYIIPSLKLKKKV